MRRKLLYILILLAAAYGPALHAAETAEADKVEILAGQDLHIEGCHKAFQPRQQFPDLRLQKKTGGADLDGGVGKGVHPDHFGRGSSQADEGVSHDFPGLFRIPAGEPEPCA